MSWRNPSSYLRLRRRPNEDTPRGLPSELDADLGAATSSICAGHAEFDRRFLEIVTRVQIGDWREFDEMWEAFASELLLHMDYEERDIYREYARERPEHEAVVDKLLAEHDAVRRRLELPAAELRVRLRVDPIELRTLVAELRMHAARENATVYPWLAERRGFSSARTHTMGTLRQSGA